MIFFEDVFDALPWFFWDPLSWSIVGIPIVIHKALGYPSRRGSKKNHAWNRGDSLSPWLSGWQVPLVWLSGCKKGSHMFPPSSSERSASGQQFVGSFWEWTVGLGPSFGTQPLGPCCCPFHQDVHVHQAPTGIPWENPSEPQAWKIGPWSPGRLAISWRWGRFLSRCVFRNMACEISELKHIFCMLLYVAICCYMLLYSIYIYSIYTYIYI